MERTVLIALAVVFSVVSAGHYFVTEGDQTCIILDANITGSIKYQTLANKTETYAFNVSTVDFVSGNCGGSNASHEQSLDIQFYPNNMRNDTGERQPWSLMLIFAQEGSRAFSLKEYHLTVFFYPDTFNTTDEEKTYAKGEHAQVDVGAEATNGFRCSDSALSLSDDSTLDFKDVRVIAFAKLNGTEFPKEQTFEQCSLDARTSEIVPIVVGACLAMLVIVVLIAYLIGRARAKRQGYASV